MELVGKSGASYIINFLMLYYAFEMFPLGKVILKCKHVLCDSKVSVEPDTWEPQSHEDGRDPTTDTGGVLGLSERLLIQEDSGMILTLEL